MVFFMLYLNLIYFNYSKNNRAQKSTQKIDKV